MAETPKAESVPTPPSVRPTSAAAKLKVSSVPSPRIRPTSAPSSSPASSPRVSAIKSGTTASKGSHLRSSIQSPSTPPPSSASPASDSAGPSRRSSSPRTLQRQPSTGPVPSSEGNASRSPHSTPSTLKRQSSSSLSTNAGVRAATRSTTSVRSKAMAASSSSSPSTSAANAATSSAARKATATQALADRKLARQQQQQGKALSSSLPPPPTPPPTATPSLVRSTSSSTSGTRSSLPSPGTPPPAPSTTSAPGTPPRRSSTLNTSSSSSSSPVIRRKAPGTTAASPPGPPPTAAVRRVTLDLSSSMGEQAVKGDGGKASTATKKCTPAGDATLRATTGARETSVALPPRADKPTAGSATGGGRVGEQPPPSSTQLRPMPPPDKAQVEGPAGIPPPPPSTESHAEATRAGSEVDPQARAKDRQQGSPHRHPEISRSTEPAKAAEAPTKDIVTAAAVEVAQEEVGSGLDGEIMGYRRLVRGEEQHLIRWQEGLDEWIDSEALTLEFPEEMEAYERWRREQGARGRPPCSGCKERGVSSSGQRGGEDDDVSIAQIENLGLIAARVLDSVRSLLHDSERTSLEAAALRQCASDFTRKKDWRDGDVLLYALDHGMAAPAAAPHGLVERARWIIEMLTTPQLVAALQAGQILSADLAADPEGTAVKNRLLDMQRLQIRVRDLHDRLGDVEDHIAKLRRRRRDLEGDVAELEDELAAQEDEG